MTAIEAASDSAVRPILIVDDDVDLVEALRDLLADEGLPVVAAGSGAAAEVAAMLHAPSLVLLDDRLGSERAPEVAVRLRRILGPRLPIILLTGDQDLEVTALATGVVDALAKPFSIEALLRTVRLHRPSSGDGGDGFDGFDGGDGFDGFDGDGVSG